MLTPKGCLQRQDRLRTLLSNQNIDAAILTDPRDIYYFTGKLFTTHFGHPSCLFLQTAGGGWVVGASDDNIHGVDDRLKYEGSNYATMNHDWTDRLVALAGPKLAATKGVKRLGWQSQSVPSLLGIAIDQKLHPTESIAIEPILFSMQRHKYPDELDIIRTSLKCEIAAYEAAHQFIRPGVTELEVLSEATRAAQNTAGEKITHDGDYRCGQGGGWATNYKLKAGDMYIIDAWTLYRGYWSDMCRTFSVGNRPTEVQLSVFDHVAAAHRLITPMFKPGTRGTEIAKALDQWLRKHKLLKETGLIHHAGHGTGLRVHMDPDLNPHREGILQEDDVVCFEPAAYVPDQGIHVRLENTYLITANGPENLSEYPFHLTR